MYVERIEDPPGFDEGGSEGLLAVIIRSGFSEPGCSFFTDNAGPLQVAHMARPAGFTVAPHAHYVQERHIRERTQEVLVIKRGRVALTIYTSAGNPVAERVLRELDAVLLVGGGHALAVIEDADFLEIKLGPYPGRHRDKYDLPVKGT